MVQTAGKLTLWGIEVFAAVAEERSISAAASRLGASPSSVSQQITNLEQAVGATLLDRSARPLTLTTAGQLFRARVEVILAEAAAARAELATRDLSRLTRLSIGVIEDFDADVTPGLLSHLGNDLSASRFLLETGPSHRLYDLLDARTLDMVVAAEMGRPADWMEVHPLLEEPFVAAVPKGALDPGTDPMETLSRMPLIRYTSRHLMGRQITRHLQRENLTLDHRYELDSYHSILAMVASGMGWTILTPLGFMRAGRFRDQADVLPLPFAPLSRRISLTARKDSLFDKPGEVAVILRPLIEDLIVGPCQARMPWLGDSLRVL